MVVTQVKGRREREGKKKRRSKSNQESERLCDMVLISAEAGDVVYHTALYDKVVISRRQEREKNREDVGVSRYVLCHS